MRIRSIGIGAALLGLIALSGGCASIAQMAAGLATSKTSNLDEAAIQARYITNLYAKSANTQEMALISSDWKEGDNAIAINLVKRTGAGFYEIDGTVTVDGEPAQYMGMGVYSKTFSGGGTAPKTVKISTTSGQVAEFKVAPPKPLKLVAVNGASADAPIDMTKDMTLTFDQSAEQGAMIRVALVTQGLGMRSFSDIGNYKLDKTVKIPAVAFKHPLLGARAEARIAPSRDRASKSGNETMDSIIVSGANTLLVERYDVYPVKAPGVGAVETVAQGWSWMPVTVSGNVPTVARIEVLGELPKEKSNVEYYSEKPNASLGKPLAEAKKLAITSLTLHGTLLRETSNSVVHTTYQFPKVPIGHWDKVLDNVYDGLVDILKDDFNAAVIPYDKVVGASTYQELADVTNAYDDYHITRTYKGLKVFGASGGGVKRVMASFADDLTETRLMRELGVDGLVSAEIHFGLQDEKTLTTVSKIVFRISGGPNGYQNATTYAAGQAVDYVGKHFNSGQFGTPNSLSTVIPQKDLLLGIRTALKEQEEKAKALGYHDIWNL